MAWRDFGWCNCISYRIIGPPIIDYDPAIKMILARKKVERMSLVTTPIMISKRSRIIALEAFESGTVMWQSNCGI